MASELLALGLTLEEINAMSHMGDLQSPDPSADQKHKQKKKNLKISFTKKKNAKHVSYWKSSNSNDSDSSNGNSDDSSFFPQSSRGVSGFHNSKTSSGRGGPFNPNTPGFLQHQLVASPSSTYGSVNHTYDLIDKMQRNLNPLLDMHNVSQFRNDNIEKIWNPNNMPVKSSVVINAPSNFPETNNNVPESLFEKEEPVRESLIITEEVNKETPEVVKSNEITYKDILEGKLETLSLTQSDSNSTSDTSKRKKKDVKIKTALYIPPQLRKRQEAEATSTSDVLKNKEASNEQKSEATHSIVKKSAAELFKKNALVSGLLKKKRSSLQSKLTPSSQSFSSLTSDSSSCVECSSPSVISDVSSKPPTHEDNFCDTDAASPSFASARSIPASPVLDLNHLVDFNDIEDRLSSPVTLELVQFHHDEDNFHSYVTSDNRPVTPPPEFEDSGCSTYSYYDEELQKTVSYTIREEPKKNQTSVLTGRLDSSHPTHPPLVSGTRSAFSPVQPRAATGNNIRNGVHINGSNIIGPNRTGLDRNSATALRENDPQRPQSYATASKGFWPVPGEEDFPPLP